MLYYHRQNLETGGDVASGILTSLTLMLKFVGRYQAAVIWVLYKDVLDFVSAYLAFTY